MQRRANLPFTKAIICTVIILGAAPDAWAGGSTTSIFGGRRMGMMANLGKPDDLTALFHNPAGLADQPGVNIYLFISPAFLTSDFRMQARDADRFPAINPAGCGTGSADPCPWPTDSEGYYTREISPEKYFGVLPYLGAATDLGFLGPRGKDFVFSLAVYSPNFYGAFLPENAPTAYSVIGGMFLVIATTAGVGWRINDYIAVGSNISYNYMQLDMSQKISLAHALTPAGQTPSGVAAFAQTSIGDLKMNFSGIDHGVGWNVGVLINPLPWIGIGISYSWSTPALFRGDVHFTAYKENIQGEEELRTLVNAFSYKLPRELELEQPLPHSLQFGVMVGLGPRVEIGTDVRLWFYQAFDKMVIRPIYEDTPGKTYQEPMTEASLSQVKNYQLSWQVNLGILVRPFSSLPGLDLMMGGGYDQSPIPDETYTLDNPNLSHVKATAGIRWQINHRWRASLTYLLNIYISRDITNSQTTPPTNVQVSSHSHSPALAVNCTF